MTPTQKKFIKLLCNDRSENPSRSFHTWAEMAYCALAKPLAGQPRGDELEARYMRHVGIIGADRTREYAEMLALVAEMLNDGPRDCLGPIMMSDDVHAHNEYIGQFFTPPDLCALMAEMTFDDSIDARIQEQGFITVQEPAVGAGAMLLAFAGVLVKRGHDLTTAAWFDCTDLSELAYHLAFIQLSLTGIPAIVRRGNTLTLEMFEQALTPAAAIFFLKHGRDCLERAQYPETPVVIGAPVIDFSTLTQANLLEQL